MARMRLLKDLYSYVKELDPETALTRTSLHRLVNEGKIPCERIGRKKLVNLDLMDRFFNGESFADIHNDDADVIPEPQQSGITPINL